MVNIVNRPIVLSININQVLFLCLDFLLDVFQFHIDHDGQYTYSNIIALHVHEIGKPQIALAPNPVTEVLFIKNAIGLANIYNNQGTLIQSMEVNTPALEVDVKDLESGMYFVEIISPTNQVSSLKFLKLQE